MKVKVFPADRAGCGYYRCIFPARAVNTSSLDVEVMVVDEWENPEEILEAKFAGPIGKPNVVAVTDPNCDVMVLQRPMDRKLIEAIPLIQAYGTAVVVEIDDDFETLSPKNPAWQATNPDRSPESNVAWFMLALTLADYITVSTESLHRRYGERGNCMVIPNFVPESYLKIEPRTKGIREDLWVGWPGNPFSHPEDLEMVGRSLRVAMDEHPEVWSYTIGHDATHKRMQVDDLYPRTHTAAWREMDDYPQMVCEYDVGLAPLKLTPFNTAKSWIKPLEYAALGVPFVASATREYKRLHKHGNVGTIAEYPSDWMRGIERLVASADLRAEQAALGRQAVRQLTYEENVEQWVQAWGMALAFRGAR